MPIRDIACLNCGHVGMLDIHLKNDVVPKERLFKHFGHNPCSGDLHYQCPACEVVLLVDPLAVMGDKSLKGFPGGAAALRLRERIGNRFGQQGHSPQSNGTKGWVHYNQDAERQGSSVGSF